MSYKIKDTQLILKFTLLARVAQWLSRRLDQLQFELDRFLNKGHPITELITQKAKELSKKSSACVNRLSKATIQENSDDTWPLDEEGY